MGWAAAKSLLIGLSLCGAGVGAEDDVLVDAVKNGIAANRSKLDQGTALMHLEYQLEGKRPAKLEIKSTWKGDLYHTKSMGEDRDNLIFSHSTDYVNRGEEEWDRLVRTDKSLIYDIAAGKRLHMLPRGLQKPMLDEFFPPKLWLQCCPPNAMEGKPYAELLKSYSGSTKERPSKFTIRRLDHGLVQLHFPEYCYGRSPKTPGNPGASHINALRSRSRRDAETRQPHENPEKTAKPSVTKFRKVQF